jgi:hypothetical protein
VIHCDQELIDVNHLHCCNNDDTNISFQLEDPNLSFHYNFYLRKDICDYHIYSIISNTVPKTSISKYNKESDRYSNTIRIERAFPIKRNLSLKEQADKLINALLNVRAFM